MTHKEILQITAKEFLIRMKIVLINGRKEFQKIWLKYLHLTNFVEHSAVKRNRLQMITNPMQKNKWWELLIYTVVLSN